MSKTVEVAPFAHRRIPTGVGEIDEAVKPEEANMHPWWENVPIPTEAHRPLDKWAECGLIDRAVKTGQTFYRGNGSGIVGDNAKTILDNIENFQLGRRVYESVRKKGEQPSKVAWAWDEGAITVDYYSGDDEISVFAMATDEKIVKKVIDLVRRYVAPPKPRGRVYIIGSGPMGPEFYSLGVASVPMERDNYEDETLSAFDKTVEELRSGSPSGRLSIFDGPPGTGKTYLIRAILDACEDAMFVFVLPNMMDALASPALVPLLIRRKESNINNGPIVFILEDGDNVLTPRGKENLSLISTLLNMTSGILGSMLDIRAIATTNSPKKDIDPALMRPGRLSQHVTVGRLGNEKAGAIYKRLTGKPYKGSWGDENPTLAQVYLKAREGGWVPPSKEIKKAGGDDDGMSVPAYEGRIVDSRSLGENFMIYPVNGSYLEE